MNATLRPGVWLTGRAWLDIDSRHVWVAHDCTTERVATMLPFPVWHSTGLAVEPSVSCEACGFHSHLQLGVPDDAYRCMETWEVDGRWCERPEDHPPNHSAGMVDWGTYERAASVPSPAQDARTERQRKVSASVDAFLDDALGPLPALPSPPPAQK